MTLGCDNLAKEEVLEMGLWERNRLGELGVCGVIEGSKVERVKRRSVMKRKRAQIEIVD